MKSPAWFLFASEHQKAELDACTAAKAKCETADAACEAAAESNAQAQAHLNAKTEAYNLDGLDSSWKARMAAVPVLERSSLDLDRARRFLGERQAELKLSEASLLKAIIAERSNPAPPIPAERAEKLRAAHMAFVEMIKSEFTIATENEAEHEALALAACELDAKLPHPRQLVANQLTALFADLPISMCGALIEDANDVRAFGKVAADIFRFGFLRRANELDNRQNQILNGRKRAAKQATG